MKLFKKILPIIIFFCTSFAQARAVKGKTPSEPIQESRPVPTQPVRNPGNSPEQPKIQSTSYANALSIIRTQMSSDKVLRNNAFTQEFINFVTSLNLSAIQIQALLEAGAHLYIQMSDNDQINEQTVVSLQNAISAISSAQRAIPTPPARMEPKAAPVPVQPNIAPKAIAPAQTIPVKSPGGAQRRKQPAARQSKAPVQPNRGTAAQPIKPMVQKNRLPEVLPLADHLTTNNLIMLFDPKRSETLETRVGAMVNDAVHGFYEQAAPMIMTSNIFEIILQIKQRIDAKQGIQSMPTVTPELLRSISNIKFEHFNYYVHKSTPVVLIIPKAYIHLNLAKAMNFDLSDQAKVCGFNPAVLTSITDITPDNFLRELRAQAGLFNEEQFISQVTSMFIPQKRNNELISPEQDIPWLIYISGHGHPAYLTVGPIRSQLKMFKSALINPRMTLTDHTGKPIARSTIESKVKAYEKQLAGKSSWPDSQLIPESAEIAGITAAQFAQLMKFFDQSINTEFIYYISCFAGGSNQSFVNETLSSLEVNYIVAAAGIHEAGTYGSLKKSFGEFFRLLKMFFTNPEEYVKRKEKKQDPIIKIVKSLSIQKNKLNPQWNEKVEQSQPFVRFPSAGFFEATPLDTRTKVLTRTMVKAHEIEKRTLDFSTTPVDLLVINTPRINTLLNLANPTIASNTAIVIPSPKDISPTYEALRTFKEIKSTSSLPLFLFNFIHLNGKAYPQTFVINTLTGIKTNLPGAQGSPIHNLIIHTQGIAGTNNMGSEQPVLQYMPLSSQDVRTSRIGMNVYVAFELNNNIYQTVLGIKNFDAISFLRTTIEAIKFTSTPQQSANMNALAGNFLTPQEIARVTQPITLESIADFIDSKIDAQDPDMALWADADEKALLEMVKSTARKQK